MSLSIESRLACALVPFAHPVFARRLRRKLGQWLQRRPSTTSQRKTRSDLLEAETEDCSKWDIIDTSQNVYNRAILFPAHWCHTGLNYFGDCVENGRLYQAFFFRGYPNVFRVW